jgi:hypothetical protein
MIKLTGFLVDSKIFKKTATFKNATATEYFCIVAIDIEFIFIDLQFV